MRVAALSKPAPAIAGGHDFHLHPKRGVLYTAESSQASPEEGTVTRAQRRRDRIMVQDTYPKPPWRERKERHIAHLRQASADVRRVSIADKLPNARAILADFRRQGDVLWNRFNGGKEGTLWYYRALVDTLRQGGASRLVEELDRVVTELERLVAAT
jgi:hypothetical protein